MILLFFELFFSEYISNMLVSLSISIMLDVQGVSNMLIRKMTDTGLKLAVGLLGGGW